MQLAPSLRVEQVGGGFLDLGELTEQSSVLIAFYRGMHSRECRQHLESLDAKAAAFAARDIIVVAISCDDKTRAQQTKRDWMLSRLQIGYGLKLQQARDWGLFVSGCVEFGPDSLEPALYAEPALYLVGQNRRIVFGSVQTMPFGRPAIPEILSSLESAASIFSRSYGYYTEDVE